MPERTPAATDFTSRSLRLETLVRLRWLAVAGQTVAVLFVEFGLGFPLPIGLCFAWIAVSALLNLVLRLRYPASLRLGTWPAFVLLAYDVVQLAGLLYLTGGLENPFAFLLLVPVIVSATALAPRPTIFLSLLVIGLASLLALAHRPLPWYPDQSLPLPLVYVAGVWVALVSACVFTGVYTYRVAKEARRLATALNATELVLAREQHLSAVDGLAAAAAHELGTPLATIALVAKELEREFPAGSLHADDIALLKSQSQRCRDILAKLTSLSGQADQHLARLPLSHLIDEVVEPYRTFGVEIAIAPGKGGGVEPVGRRNPAIVYGLANLVENAVDFALSRVDVASEWTDKEVAVTIKDDGPGFAPGIIDRIGEPYVTTRGPSDGGSAGDHDHEAGGLGLGFFIAKTLLERTGARLKFANRDSPESGAVVRVVWPRAVMDFDTSGEAPPETIAAGTSWRAPVKSL
jgi:two-component system sensor histidine kinase RegB